MSYYKSTFNQGGDNYLLVKIIGGLFVIIIIGGLAYFFSSKKDFNEPGRIANDEDGWEEVLRDSDHDGLTDELEEMYGTDIYKKDSDGDGYSDYVEVKKGFNPLGEGKINERQIDIVSIDEKTTQVETIKDLQKKQQLENWDCNEIPKQGRDLGWIGIERDDCYYAKAEGLLDAGYCKKISNSTNRADCYYGLASLLGDASLCRYAKGGLFGESSCVKRVARDKDDIEICKYLYTEEDMIEYNSCVRNVEQSR